MLGVKLRKAFEMKEVSIFRNKEQRAKCDVCGEEEIEDHCETVTLEPSIVEGIRMISNRFPGVDLDKVSEEEYGKYYDQVPENSGWEWLVCRKCQRKLKKFLLENGYLTLIILQSMEKRRS
jgi:hypothetical protein